MACEFDGKIKSGTSHVLRDTPSSSAKSILFLYSLNSSGTLAQCLASEYRLSEGLSIPTKSKYSRLESKFYPSHHLDYRFHLLQSNRCSSRQLLNFVKTEVLLATWLSFSCVPVVPPVDERLQFIRSFRTGWYTSLDDSLNVSIVIPRNYVTQEE